MSDKLTINVDFDKLPDNRRAVVEVYNLIASAAGVDPDKVKEYDCTKIDYSLNAEKLIFEKAGTEADKVQVCVALAMGGMKVDKSLENNKAVIHRGGIVMDDDRDILDVIFEKEHGKVVDPYLKVIDKVIENNPQNEIMNESFEEVILLGKPAMFTSIRLNHSDVPKGYNIYELRHDDDCNGDVVQVGKRIIVNHWGTVIMRDKLALDANGLLDIEPDDINYGTGDCNTMKEYIAKYPAQHKEHER